MLRKTAIMCRAIYGYVLTVLRNQGDPSTMLGMTARTKETVSMPSIIAGFPPTRE